MGERLWDARAQDEYTRLRDDAIERRVDQREGTSIARDIDATWSLLPADESHVLEYLVLSGTRSFIGHCSDPTLARLVERGMLSWPPGVRPVLTDDLATVFSVAPALWVALGARRDAMLAKHDDAVQWLQLARVQYEGRLTPLASDDAQGPGARAG